MEVYFLTVLEDGKFKVKVPVVFVRASVLTGCLLSVCSHGKMGEVVLWNLFYIGTNP